MISERIRVLLLDDEHSLREPLRRYLENSFGYAVDSAASGHEALSIVEAAQGHYDVALIDQHLESEPEQDGIEVMRQIRQKYPDIECIIFTGWGSEHRQRALEAGGFRYLEKPFDNQELALLIRTAAQQVRLRIIGRDILSELDLNQVLEGIVAAVRSLALADEAEVLLVDEQSKQIQLGAKTYPGAPLIPYALDDADLSQWIMQSERTFYVPNAQNDPKVTPTLMAAGLQSFVGIPVPGEAGPLGVLYVYSQRPGHFDAWGTLALLGTFASQAGLAITNARAFKQIRHHAGYMEALVRVGRGLTQVKELDTQLQLAWEFVHQQLQVSTFYIALYDVQEDALTFPLAYDHGQTLNVSERRLTDEHSTWGISGYVVKAAQETRWATASDGESLCQILDVSPILVGNTTMPQSNFTYPLKIGESVIGVISIQSDESFAFSKVLLDAFRALGSQLSVALETARLFKEEAQRRKEAEALREATLALTTSLPDGRVFDKILIELRKVVPFDSASLQLLKGNHLEVIGGWGFPKPDELVGICFSLDDDNPNHEVVESRTPVIIPDAPKRYRQMGLPPHNQLNIRGWLGVPMFDGQTLIGMLALDKQQPNFYTKAHARLAQAFAAQAAVTVRNVQLLQETQNAKEQLQAFYEASTAIVSSKDPEAVLQDIVDRACVAAKAFGVSVILIDRTAQIRQVITTGVDRPDNLRRIIRKNGNTMKVLRTGKPVIIENVAMEPERVNSTTMQRGIAAEVCLPILLEGEHIGVVWVRYPKPRSFSQSEIDAIQLYVNQAALAYDSARRIKELNNIRKISETLAGAADLREVLLQIVVGAREVLQAESAAIWSYDDARGQFLLDHSISSGISAEVWERFLAEKPGLGRTADTVAERGWVGVTDVSDVERYTFLGESTRQLLEQINVRSFQGIPLLVGDEKLGVLYVNYTYRRDFNPEERERARAVANQAALALKKARLMEQVAHARDTAKVVAEVSILGDLQRTLDAIAKGTLETLECDAVSLYVYNQDRDEFEFPPTLAGVNNNEAILTAGREGRQSVVWKILALEEMHVAENAPDDPVMRGTFVRMENIASSVGIPLRVGRQKVGVMFANYRTPHHFTSEELANTELFAHQATVAIQNAQLYDEATRKANILATIYDAGKIVTSTLALEEILDRIVEQAYNLTSHEGNSASFSNLAEVQGTKLVSIGAHPPECLQEIQSRLGEVNLTENNGIGIMGRTVKTKQSQRVGDVQQDPDYIQYKPLSRSELAVPINLGDEVIGVINVEHTDVDAFDGDDQRTLELLAAQAAIAIRNAKMYEELKKARGQVYARTMLAWVGMTSAAWRHTIDKHALTIQEQAQLLQRDFKNINLTESHPKLLERVTRMERLATEILKKPTTPSPSSETGIVSIPLNSLIGERVQQLWRNSPFREVRLVLELILSEQATVLGNPEWLRTAFDFLVENAVRAVMSQPVREIVIRTQRVKKMAGILISDTGPGIPEEILSKIGFDMIEKPEDAKGLGIGLLMSQTIVQTYGGEIRVAHTGPGGTTMVIALPLEKGEEID